MSDHLNDRLNDRLNNDVNAPLQVVVNDEDQYSLWPVDRRPPAGWRTEGFTGGRRECLAHIEEVWTDMRPRSVRLREGGAE